MNREVINLKHEDLEELHLEILKSLVDYGASAGKFGYKYYVPFLAMLDAMMGDKNKLFCEDLRNTLFEAIINYTSVFLLSDEDTFFSTKDNLVRAFKLAIEMLESIEGVESVGGEA